MYLTLLVYLTQLMSLKLFKFRFQRFRMQIDQEKLSKFWQSAK